MQPCVSSQGHQVISCEPAVAVLILSNRMSIYHFCRALLTWMDVATWSTISVTRWLAVCRLCLAFIGSKWFGMTNITSRNVFSAFCCHLWIDLWTSSATAFDRKPCDGKEYKYCYVLAAALIWKELTCTVQFLDTAVLMFSMCVKFVYNAKFTNEQRVFMHNASDTVGRIHAPS